jgi:hypothetical protein
MLDRHLAECDSCRVLIQQTPAPDDLLAGVLARARSWESAEQPDVTTGRIADCVRPYLGLRATDKLVSAASPDGSDLLSGIEPVLEVFLGRRAAGRLVTSVMDRAFVRR